MKGTCYKFLTKTMFVASCIVPLPAAALEIGDLAPDFLLPGVDGKTYALKDFAKAKLLVVVFISNHCPTSQAYEDRLIAIARDYMPRNVAMVAISPNDPLAFRKDELGYTAVDDSFAGMKIRAARKGFPFPYLYDGEDQNCSRAYEPRVTPQAFLFGKERHLHYFGRIDNGVDPRKVYHRDLRSAIERVLAEKTIRSPKTKIFGCPIKWSKGRELAVNNLAFLERETVTLKKLDDDTLDFHLANKSKRLKLFFVWSPSQHGIEDAFSQLVEVHRRYRKRGLDIITIAAKTSLDEEKVLAFLKGQHASCRNYFVGDVPEVLFQKFAPRARGPLPFVMLVQSGGKRSFQRAGPLDPLGLKRAILEIFGRNYNP